MATETATATPRSPVSVTVTARDHAVVQDKPPHNGGADEGMMASELLMASLLACQHSTFVKVAAKRGSDAEVASIDAELSFDDKEDFAGIRLTWRFKGPVDDQEAATLMRLTDRVCTVSRALKFDIESVVGS